MTASTTEPPPEETSPSLAWLSAWLVLNHQAEQQSIAARLAKKIAPLWKILRFGDLKGTRTPWIQAVLPEVEAAYQESQRTAQEFAIDYRHAQLPTAEELPEVTGVGPTGPVDLARSGQLSTPESARPSRPPERLVRGNPMSPAEQPSTPSVPEVPTARAQVLVDTEFEPARAVVSLASTGPGEVAHRTPSVVTVNVSAPERQALETEAMRAGEVKSLRVAVRTAIDGGRNVVRRAVELDHATLGFARVLNTNPCYFCAMLASRGAVYKLNSFAASTKEFDGSGVAKVHDGCVVEGTAVSARGVRALTRRRYSGDVIDLAVAGGKKLTVTPNHPILTLRGWVPAELVNNADHLVSRAREYWPARGVPNENDVPALVEEVWRAAAMSGGVGAVPVPLAPEDFHGDGAVDGEVDVIRTDGLLLNVGNVAFGESSGEFDFVLGDAVKGLFLAGGHFDSVSEGHATLGPSLPGGAGDRGAFLGGRPDVPEQSGGGDVADLEASLTDAQVDQIAAVAVSGGERLCGHPALIEVDDFGNEIFWQLNAESAGFDAPDLQSAFEDTTAYADVGSSLLRRLAGEVSTHRVIKQERRSFTGHVYNLETSEGWYAAEDFVISNCRCGLRPVYSFTDFRDPTAVQLIKQWNEHTEGLGGQDAINAFRRNYTPPEPPEVPRIDLHSLIVARDNLVTDGFAEDSTQVQWMDRQIGRFGAILTTGDVPPAMTAPLGRRRRTPQRRPNGNTPRRPSSDSEPLADKAKRYLPGLKLALERQLARGDAEDSEGVQWSRTQIARFKSYL